MKKTLLFAIALAVAGCNKGSQTPPAETAAPEKAPAVAPAAAVPAAPAAAPAAPAATITDEKLKGFLVYQREMLPLNKEAVQIAMGAFKKAGPDADKMQKEMAADERIKKFQVASEEALKKAGIQMSDVSALTIATTEYFSRRSLAIDATKSLEEIAQRKTAGKPGLADSALEEVHQGTITKSDEARADFEKKHGKEALALLDKYEPEFLSLMKEQMEAIMPSRSAPGANDPNDSKK